MRVEDFERAADAVRYHYPAICEPNSASHPKQRHLPRHIRTTQIDRGLRSQSPDGVSVEMRSPERPRHLVSFAVPANKRWVFPGADYREASRLPATRTITLR